MKRFLVVESSRSLSAYEYPPAESANFTSALPSPATSNNVMDVTQQKIHIAFFQQKHFQYFSYLTVTTRVVERLNFLIALIARLIIFTVR